MRNNILLKISVMAMSVAGLAACSEKDAAVDNTLQFAEGEYPLAITAQVSTPLESRSATVNGSWTATDSIAVQVVGSSGEATIHTYTYNGSSWTSAEPYYWQSATEELSVDAWFPYATAKPTSVTVTSDQSTAANYQTNDVLLVEGVSVTFGNTATLDLTHQTAKLSVTLSAGDGFETTDLADATVTFNNLSSVEDASDGEGVITAYNSEDATYLALLAPQTLTSGTHFITVTVGSKEYYYSLSSGLTLSAGYQYEYSITVNKTGLSVTVTLEEWDDKGTEQGSAEASGYILDDSGNYIVYNARGLKAWNKAVQSDLSISCTLVADIDMGGYEWTPVGTTSNPYTGTFDGADHTISNLTVTEVNDRYAGLFGITQGATIMNLRLENVDINVTGEYYYVGGIAGYTGGNTTIIGCSVSGSLIMTSASMDSGGLGGIVGNVWGSTSIIGCFVTATICTNSGTYRAQGGIVGYSLSTLTLSACAMAGTMTRSYSTDSGGIIGTNASDGTATVNSCYWQTSDAATTMYGSNYGTIQETTGTTISDSYGKIETMTWSEAATAMNSAITTWNSDSSNTQCLWHYSYDTDLSLESGAPTE